MLRVHVAGAVRRPGVQSLPASARVMDAIMSAGGAVTQSDVQRLNLAAHLQDGQQIIVPRSGEAHLAARAQTALPSELRSEQQLAEQQLAGQQLVARQAPGGRPLPAKPINVNTASVEELEALPGIGPAIAGRIVRYRQEHGQFRSLQELDAVKGLGIKKLQKLQPYVVF
ncbi:MAG TPA: helix-hairpin-helix domain-containing protein [Abditibacteriaceae bacterium]